MRDEDARRRRDRRDRGAAAVEDDDVGLERGGEPRALEHVRRERRTRHAAARAAAADRRDARERCGLEMIGRRMAARTRERDQIGDGRRSLDQLRLRRAAPPHRDDDDAPVAREQPRDVPGHRGLADALAGADHGERRQLERVERRRVETEVGADVRQAEREEARREREPQLRRQHRLVGQVDDDLAPSPGSSTIGTP